MRTFDAKLPYRIIEIKMFVGFSYKIQQQIKCIFLFWEYLTARFYDVETKTKCGRYSKVRTHYFDSKEECEKFIDLETKKQIFTKSETIIFESPISKS